MVTKFVGYDNLNAIDCELKSLSDTQLRFYDLGDLHRRLNSEPLHPIARKLKESGLVEAVQALELILECIARYDPSTHRIKMPNNQVLLTIDRKTMENCFRLPAREVFNEMDF